MINKLNHFLTVSVTPSHLTEVVVERFSNRQWISNYTLVINQRNLWLLLLFPLFGSRDLKLFQNSPWCLVFVDASMQNAFNPFRFKDVTLFICFLNSSQEVFVGFFACFLNNRLRREISRWICGVIQGNWSPLTRFFSDISKSSYLVYCSAENIDMLSTEGFFTSTKERSNTVHTVVHNQKCLH